MTTLKIGELARKGNVNMFRLRFIKRSQALGFTLTEIKELLASKLTPTNRALTWCIAARQKAQEVRAKIAPLRAIGRVLDNMKASCEGRWRPD